jgi:hypothetical protein
MNSSLFSLPFDFLLTLKFFSQKIIAPARGGGGEEKILINSFPLIDGHLINYSRLGQNYLFTARVCEKRGIKK